VFRGGGRNDAPHLSNSKQTTAIQQAAREPWREAEWQSLWLSLKAKPWTSLAVVPGGKGGPADFTLTVAVTLARIGIMHLGMQIHVADATKIPLVRLEQFTEEVRRLSEEGDLVLIALPPIEENPVTVSIARASGAAVLCILMEKMNSSETKKTVERIGAAHFLGSIMFHGDELV
jgi:hypothetical protein